MEICFAPSLLYVILHDVLSTNWLGQQSVLRYKIKQIRDNKSTS